MSLQTVSTTFPDSVYSTGNKPSVATLKSDISSLETTVNDHAANAADLTSSQTLTNKVLTSPVINTQITGTAIVDEDSMVSDSAVKVPTQQSVKAYVDSGTVTMTNKTLTSPVINTAISGTAIASGAEVTTGTDDTQIVTPKAIGDAGLNTRLKSKIITGTRDMTAASGDVSYTSVGFTPTSVLCIANINNTGASAVHSMGVSDSSVAENSIEINDGVSINQTSSFLSLLVSAGNIQSAVVKTYDADGFTLTWTKTGSPTGTGQLIFLCFR